VRLDQRDRKGRERDWIDLKEEGVEKQRRER
jgi:hypothetical protein